MAISKLGAGGGSDYWELITSVTPTAGTGAINFTGLAVYKKLLVEVNGATTALAAQLLLRLNNDNTANAYWASLILDGGNVSIIPGTSFPLNNSTGTHNAFFILSSCDNNGLKIVDGGGGIDTDRNFFSGFYKASAVVSQVNLVLSTSTFNAVGTISLFGVK